MLTRIVMFFDPSFKIICLTYIDFIRWIRKSLNIKNHVLIIAYWRVRVLPE